MALLSQALLAKLNKKKFTVKTRRRGSHKGSRSASMLGSSLEFSDYRIYQPGDDVRQVDWNVYGRTQKHYIKRFLDEQELNVSIFLDATSSMRALPSKWERAKQIAAAFSYIILSSEDRLRFIPVSAQTAGIISRKGAVYGKRTISEILQLSETERTGSFTENLEKYSLRKNQLAIIITDGMEPVERFSQLLRKLAINKQEVRFLQILSEQELDPDYEGDLKLVDSETRAFMNISMHASILEDYKNRLREHNDALAALCKKFGVSYLLMGDGQDLQEFLFHECTAKGWLR